MPLTLAQFTDSVVSFAAQIMKSAARLSHVQDGASVLVPSGYKMSRYINTPTGTALTAVKNAITGISTTVHGVNAQIDAAIIALQQTDLANVTAVTQAANALLGATPATVGRLLQGYITAIQNSAPIDAITLLFGLANSIPITSKSQTFSRASPATYLNESGILETVAANVLRQDSFFPISTNAGTQNYVRNSTNQGLINGTPGVLPTNWLLSPTPGLTVTIVGNGIANNMSYVDIQYAGTAAGGTGFISLYADSTTVVPNEVWTGSFYAQVIAGTTAQIYATIYSFNSTGISTGKASVVSTPSTTLTRFSVQSTIPLTATTINFAAEINEQIGTPINVTVRYAGFQLERGSSPSAFVPTPVIRAELPLIENAATNLLLHSNPIGGTGWTSTATVITQNAAIAPDGTLTASHITETNVSSQHNVSAPFTVIVGSLYTFSLFVKAAEYTQMLLGLSGGSSSVFDLQLGTVISSTSPSFIQALSNGWYRIGIQATVSNQGNFIICPSTNVGTYVGVNGRGVFAWGAQVELGPSETSYIATTGSTATRAADFIEFISYDSPYVLAFYSLILCALGNAITNYTPATSNEAQNILTQFIALFDATIAPASDLDWIATSNSLGVLRQNVLQYLQEQVAIEPKVLTQVFNDSLPDVVAAYMIYGDATKADLLVQTNNPANPLYLGTNVSYAINT